MSLYKKYRPSTFDDIVGNSVTIQALKKSVEGRKNHVFLFTGPSGCGKTTLSRIVAKELGAKGSDFRELDSADFRGIDTIRNLRKTIGYHPLESKVVVYLLDEVHKLTGDAQNAMLKMLEETPEHVYFILATTDPQKLLGTIKGRCSIYTVEALEDRKLTRLLKTVTKKENKTIEKEVLEQIIQDSFGQPRNALQILEQVLSVDSEQRLKIAKRQAEKQSQTLQLCQALLNKKSWKYTSAILRGLKKDDSETIRRQVLGYAAAVLSKSENDTAALIIEEFIEPFFNSGFAGVVLASYSVIKN